MNSKNRLRIGGWALAIGLVAGPASALDLTVAHIEVTQGVQRADNSIPLVAQRSTAVRVAVGVADSTPSRVHVTGRLHVFVNGFAITPADGVPPLPRMIGSVAFEPSVPPEDPARESEQDTLNFELPAPTGIPESNDVDFRVEVEPISLSILETNTSNNSGSVSDLRFVARRTPLIWTVPVNYPPGGFGLPSDDLLRRGVADAMVRAIFPVNDGDPELYVPDRIPPITFDEDPNGDGRINNDGTENNLLKATLAAARHLIVDDGLGVVDRRFLYGWFAGSPLVNQNGDPINGFAPLNGRVGCGVTNVGSYQGTFAHELCHNFGLQHPAETDPAGPQQIDEVGWDVGARLIDHPSENDVEDRVKPTSLFDLMVGGRSTRNRWIHSDHYTELFNHPVLSTAGERTLRRILVIMGMFDRNGKVLIKLWPAFRFPWPSQVSLPVGQLQKLPYAVQVQTVAGKRITVPFDARVAVDGEKDEVQYGFFEVLVPVEGEVSAIRIIDPAGRKVFGAMDRSPASPHLRILAPAPGASLNGKARVAWKVEDADTPASQLVYHVAYSPDEGRSFVPIGVNLTRTEFTFDAKRVMPTRGAGLIRVFVSDGLNTSHADVGALSTP